MLTGVHPYAYIFSTYKHRVVMNNEMIEQHNEKWYNLVFFFFNFSLLRTLQYFLLHIKFESF